MLTLSPTTRIVVAVAPIDMRKSFNGLSAAVQTILDHDVLSGGLFFFTNRLKTRVKAIYWDSCEAVRNVKSRRRRPFNASTNVRGLHITRVRSEGFQPCEDGGVCAP
jgi:hypothetical protein